MMASFRFRNLFFSFVMMAVLLSGCMSPVKVPEDRFYRLPPISEIARTGTHIDGVVGVGRIMVGDLYRERSMLYIDEARPLELRRYHYRYWTETPGELVQQYLMNYLQSVNAADSVVRYTGTFAGMNVTGMKRAPATVAGVIDGRLVRFERRINHTQVKIQVSLALQYRDSRKPDHPVFERQYSREVVAANNSMQASVVSFGDALQQIFADFLRDITRDILRDNTQGNP
jgi:uncharacterized lipoprotein YmbA